MKNFNGYYGIRFSLSRKDLFACIYFLLILSAVAVIVT